jgi:hypothetical protein
MRIQTDAIGGKFGGSGAPPLRDPSAAQSSVHLSQRFGPCNAWYESRRVSLSGTEAGRVPGRWPPAAFDLDLPGHAVSRLGLVRGGQWTRTRIVDV